MIFSETEKNRLETYLKKIKIEFSMRDRLDGWTIEWLKQKIIDIETKLGKIKKHKFKND
tara:strand:+ start:1851 stop:2027 length:177 start_codon:yes stop_codon:yes gene_type:complete